ncbi:MAG: glucose-1-phosphate thymidylyltransferase [Chitinophagaceae bacterium]|nr:glucose-1-phosphate thymidylyltransferase [Chitinophagaceae bacterium]
MKIVIPVAGAGAKLRPHTYTQPKPLIPLAGKTILSFIMDQFIEAGMIDFVFVIGYLGEKIKHFVAEKYPGINASFVVQDQHSGTGHAVLLTQDLFAPGEEMLVVYGDTICEFDLNAVLTSPNSTVGIKKVDDPRDFGVAELNGHGQILHAIEKPKIPKSNMALVGIYKIKETAQLFNIISEAIQQNAPQEEYTLTQAIDTLAKSGVIIDTFSVNNWFDCGKKESLLATNAILLAEAEYASEEIPFFDNTIILHPVSIAKGCLIENSIIGPNVSIGEHAVIRGSMIRDSIIGSYSEIKQIALHSSLIGSDASISGASQRLNIGDNTEIDFSK